MPHMLKKPIDLPSIISVELIQISDITNIPYAPKAKKVLEKIKKEKEKIVSKQAPPKIAKKEKPEAIPLPDKVEKQKKIKTKKQNPKKIDTEIKQASEFEKKELFNPDEIAALIDKSKIEKAETTLKSNKITQSEDKNSTTPSLTLSEEDALKAQIYGKPRGILQQPNIWAFKASSSLKVKLGVVEFLSSLCVILLLLSVVSAFSILDLSIKAAISSGLNSSFFSNSDACFISVSIFFGFCFLVFIFFCFSTLSGSGIASGFSFLAIFGGACLETIFSFSFFIFSSTFFALGA
jgi:hypothetical protein